MTDLITELKALSEKATPGPFIVSTCASPEESKGEVTLDALRSGGMGEVVYRYKWIKNRADCDLDAALRNHLPTILAKLEEGERMREALRLVLPMAKGYAHEHPVGSNQEHVNHAVEVMESTHDH